MQYLSRNELLDIHGYIVERFGGRLGLNSLDRLVSLVDAPSQMMFDQELYTSVAEKAAVMAYFLIKNRPFRSGNEPTALLAVLRFVAINNHTIDDISALAAELRAVARSERDQDTLSNWLEDHLRPAA